MKKWFLKNHILGFKVLFNNERLVPTSILTRALFFILLRYMNFKRLDFRYIFRFKNNFGL